MRLVNVGDEYAVYAMLFSLSNRIQTVGDKEFGEVTMKQHFLMIGLGLFKESPTLKEVSELIGCSYQNVKRMADHLQKQGYLLLERDKEDRRKIRITAKDKMWEFAAEKRRESVEFMKTLFRDISKEDLNITLRTLAKMDRNIGGVIE